jgi:hypothetical protein
LTFSIGIPDRYVVVAYEDLNGAIGKYNDSLKLEVKSLARSCNISDLATVFDVSPTTLEVNKSVGITLKPTTNVNVAILKEADWSSIKAGQSIRNSTILNNSIWSITNIGSSAEIVTTVPMTSVGDYVVVLYNVTQYDYVGCYNDSTTVTVKAAEPWQNYDQDRSGKIETSELITAIQDWLSNKLSTNDLINVIQKWLQS